MDVLLSALEKNDRSDTSLSSTDKDMGLEVVPSQDCMKNLTSTEL